MASKVEFVEFVADQLRGAGEITYRKMFGEYGLYCDGKIFAVVCDDQLFVKITETGKALHPEFLEAPPYEGAKNYFLVEDVENQDMLTELARVTCAELPPPKPKKAKTQKTKKADGDRLGAAALGSVKKSKAFDFKKEYKEFYLPGKRPELVAVPKMNFLAVRGMGDPNEEGGAYKEAIGLLYGIAFTIKMSKMGDHRIEGYFDYVVPPLEGLWQQEAGPVGGKKGRSFGIDYTHKESFQWISMIRLPDFVTKEEFEWAVSEAETKKQTDFSKVEFFTYDEGLCVQCMHVGPYDDEPETIEIMDRFVKEQGYVADMGDERRHHEIYLSDVRRCKPENLKTVIRQPVRKR